MHYVCIAYLTKSESGKSAENSMSLSEEGFFKTDDVSIHLQAYGEASSIANASTEASNADLASLGYPMD